MQSTEPHSVDLIDAGSYCVSTSRYWKELLIGFQPFNEFQHVNTPYDIIRVVNKIIGDNNLQTRNEHVVKNLLESKDGDIEAARLREEHLKEEISTLNSQLERCRGGGAGVEGSRTDPISLCGGGEGFRIGVGMTRSESDVSRIGERVVRSESENCEKCEQLKQRCQLLQMENEQWGREFSCRHDALQDLQNKLKFAEQNEYPAELEAKCERYEEEVRMLKQQLEQCHEITLEMQQKCLRKPEGTNDELRALLSTCKSLEVENKHLKEKLSCKYDVELKLKKKEMTIAEYERRINELEDICRRRENDEKKEEATPSTSKGWHTSKKLEDLKVRLEEIQNEIKRFEEDIALQMKVRNENKEDITVNNNEDLLIENNELKTQIEQLNQKLSDNGDYLDMLCNNASPPGVMNGDKEVTLRHKDERRTYGIWFGRRRGPLTNRESKFFIVKINNSSADAKLLRVGDHVIKMNGINVQQASSACVKNILTRSMRSELSLVVRTHRRECEEKNICGGTYGGNDWGCSLGVFVKDIHCNSYARKLGLQEYDEIVIVNEKDVAMLNLSQIQQKMKKYVTLTVRRIKEEFFNLPDAIFNNIRTTGDGSEGVGDSDESLYVASRPGYQSMFQLNTPIQAEGRVNSVSMATLLSPNQMLATKLNLNIIELTINKEEWKSFGMNLIGGNTTGIYIKQVDLHMPAAETGVEEGWKLLQIEGYRLENIALGFATDIVNSMKKKEEVRMIFEKTHYECYKETMNKVPHDCFHVKALEDHNQGSYHFKKDDIFCVKNSYFQDEEDNSTIKWEATVTDPYGRNVDVIIPSQRAKIVAIQEELKPSKRRSLGFSKKSGHYYEILDDVDVMYSEMEDVVVS